jgi:hypothetical protein
MNYEEVKSVALAYSNRSDQDLISNIDNFLRMTEAKLNRELHVQRQSKRAVVQTVDGQEYYGLPADFAGLRDIETRVDASSKGRITFQYRSPEQFNNIANAGGTACVYTIIADQLQIWPSTDGEILEIVYYATLPPLGTLNQENWLSKRYPDLYIFGLMVEISAFAKDVDASMIWSQRFDGAIASIDLKDDKERWSGTSLQVNLG